MFQFRDCFTINISALTVIVTAILNKNNLTTLFRSRADFKDYQIVLIVIWIAFILIIEIENDNRMLVSDVSQLMICDYCMANEAWGRVVRGFNWGVNWSIFIYKQTSTSQVDRWQYWCFNWTLRETTPLGTQWGLLGEIMIGGL